MVSCFTGFLNILSHMLGSILLYSGYCISKITVETSQSLGWWHFFFRESFCLLMPRVWGNHYFGINLIWFQGLVSLEAKMQSPEWAFLFPTSGSPLFLGCKGLRASTQCEKHLPKLPPPDRPRPLLLEGCHSHPPASDLPLSTLQMPPTEEWPVLLSPVLRATLFSVVLVHNSSNTC